MIAPQQTAATPFQSASLYVGDLHPEVTESLLFELFNRVGPVASIRVCRDSVTRRSLGYAYVNFHSVEDAERALDTMNFTEIKSKPCRIMWSQRDPSLRKSGLGNVYVRNLAPSVDNKGLYDTFSVSGNILSCKVATDDAGVSKGYGYVHFETAEAAQDAIQKFNGILIEEVEVSVSAFVKRSDRAGQAEWTNLYVKQFPLSWGDEELLQVFSPFGAVVSCAVSKDADGKSKGFGFVNFAEHDSAVKALAELHGKKIDVKQSAEEIAAEQLKIAEKEKERLASEVLTANVANAAAATAEKTEAGKEGADKENAEGAENKEEKKEGEKEEVEKKEGGDKSAAVAATAAATAALGVRVYELYVSRAQKKVERTREMKHKIDAIAQEKITKYTGMNLYVKNVADSISDDEFREAFAPFGTITSARVMRDGTDPTKGSKGFGFVCYSSPEEATRAVTEMNGKSLSGKPIVVTLHQRKDARRLHLAATYAPQNMGGVGMRGPGFGPQGGMPGQPGMPMPPFMNMYMPPGAQPGFPGPGGVGGPRGGMPYGFPGNPMNAGGRGFFPGMPPFMQGMPGGPGQQPGMGPNGFKGQRGPGGQNMPPGAFPVGMAGGPMPGQARGGGGMRMPGGGPQQGGPAVGGPGPGMGAGRPMSGMPGSMPPGASAGGVRGGAMFPPGQMPPPGSVQQAQAQAQAQQMRGGVKFNSQARNQQPGMMGGGGPGGGAGPMGVGAGGPGGMPTPQQQQQAMQQAVMAQQMHMQQQQQMAQQQQQQHQQAQGPPQGGKLDFSDAVLASADPLTQKNMIGERLYPLIFDHQPEQAGKITGMLLEMDNGELLNLIESPDALMSKIEEALTVLRNHKPADE